MSVSLFGTQGGGGVKNKKPAESSSNILSHSTSNEVHYKLDKSGEVKKTQVNIRYRSQIARQRPDDLFIRCSTFTYHNDIFITMWPTFNSNSNRFWLLLAILCTVGNFDI